MGEIIKMSSFLALLFLTTTCIVADSIGHHHLKETKFVVFMHDFYGGPNATVTIVAGIPGKEWGFFKFGTVAVSDDLVTEGISLHSKHIGRAQAINTVCSLDGINVQAPLSILFTNGKYNGSTLELQAVYNQFATVIEYPILSGTGKFRFATGFAVLEMLVNIPTKFYVAYRANITVKHN